MTYDNEGYILPRMAVVTDCGDVVTTDPETVRKYAADHGENDPHLVQLSEDDYLTPDQLRLLELVGRPRTAEEQAELSRLIEPAQASASTDSSSSQNEGGGLTSTA